MSDFCFDDEACHARQVMGEGAMPEALRVCKMVKDGERAATRTEPFS